MALKEKFELCSSKIRRDIAFAGACLLGFVLLVMVCVY
jgi:hypothetical protein